MEALEEALCSHSSEYNNCNGEYFMQPAAVAKGKRTKRRRSHQRLVESIAIVGDSSSTSSAELEGSITEEDEDMAICLMLLARGRTADSEPEPEALREEAGGASTEKFTTRRVAEASTTTSVYECKTCNKCFPSFQALGGHRASHKKPKLTTVKEIAAAEEKKATIHDDMLQLRVNSFSKPVVGSEQSTISKAKIHECSICGSEFSSGQALGGHMRRHRAAAVNPESQESKKERSLILLSLDLNLPAPAEDESVYVDTQRPPSPAYAFTGQARPLIFAASASALVDCHY